MVCSSPPSHKVGKPQISQIILSWHCYELTSRNIINNMGVPLGQSQKPMDNLL